MEMFYCNKIPVLVSICLLLGIIHSSTAQLEKTINEMIKAEVSKQLQEIQKDFIKQEEFTRVQQDVKRVHEDLDNSIQGIAKHYITIRDRLVDIQGSALRFLKKKSLFPYRSYEN